MYECEAENQFKVSKAFINIDGNKIKSIKKERKKNFFFSSLETILFNTTTIPTTILPKFYRTSSSPSYGGFHYIWQMERRLAL